MSINKIKKNFSLVGIFVLLLSLNFAGCSNIENRSDQLLAQLSTYDYKEGLEKLSNFSDLVTEAAASESNSRTVEKSMIKFLLSDATLDSKQFVCKQLSIFGTEASVPVLSQLLSDEKTSDMARYTLERIPGKESQEALINQLGAESKKIKIGCLTSLGVINSEAAVNKISELLKSEDADVAVAAAQALGNIPSDESITILKEQLNIPNESLQVVVADSYLRCADNLSTKDATNAVGIYNEIYKSKLSLSQRQAALVGLITSSDKKEDIILNVMNSDNEALKYIAIEEIRQLPSSSNISKFNSLLTDLSPENQIQLLAVIKDREDKTAKNKVLDLLKSNEPMVRIASLQTLSVIGDYSDVNRIAMIASSRSGLERRTARDCLDQISDDKTDNVIVENISLTEKKVKIELIRSAGARGISFSFDVLLKNTDAEDRQVRTAAYLAISEIATENQLPVLIDQLYSLPFESDRTRMERTISRILSIYPKEELVNILIKNIDSDKSDENKGSSLKLLGVTGNSLALEKLRQNVNNSNQTIKIGAIEGLASWSTPEPLYDLMDATEKAENSKVLQPALEGFTKFIRMDETLSDSLKFKYYVKALKYSKTGNEKNFVLEGIGNVDLYESLEVLKKYYKDPSVTETVEDGINRVAWHLLEKDPAKIKTYVAEIIEMTTDEDYKERLERIISTADLAINK